MLTSPDQIRRKERESSGSGQEGTGQDPFQGHTGTRVSKETATAGLRKIHCRALAGAPPVFAPMALGDGDLLGGNNGMAWQHCATSSATTIRRASMGAGS